MRMGDVMRRDEVRDVLALLALAMAVPLAPDVHFGPYHAIHPQSLARLVLLVAFISSAGYVAQRALGARIGLVASGFASGFVSSTATIGALGLRAKAHASLGPSAAAGAAASSIATVVQYATIIAAIEPLLLRVVVLPLGLAGAAALAATFALARASGGEAAAAEPPRGRMLQLWPALWIGVASAVVAIASKAFASAIGNAGIVLVSSASGFVDAHATTASIATLHQAREIDDEMAGLAIVAALSANTLTKVVIALASGPRAYALRVTIGVLAIAAASWLGLVLR